MDTVVTLLDTQAHEKNIFSRALIIITGSPDKDTHKMRARSEGCDVVRDTQHKETTVSLWLEQFNATCSGVNVSAALDRCLTPELYLANSQNCRPINAFSMFKKHFERCHEQKGWQVATALLAMSSISFLMQSLSLPSYLRSV